MQMSFLVMPQHMGCGLDQAKVDWDAFKGMLESFGFGFTA